MAPAADRAHPQLLVLAPPERRVVAMLAEPLGAGRDGAVDEGRVAEVVGHRRRGRRPAQARGPAVAVDRHRVTDDERQVGPRREHLERPREALRVHEVVPVHPGEERGVDEVGQLVEPHRGPEVLGVPDEADAGVREPGEQVGTAVGRPVVEEDQAPVGVRLGDDRPDHVEQRRGVVPERDDDGHGGHGPAPSPRGRRPGRCASGVGTAAPDQTSRSARSTSGRAHGEPAMTRWASAGDGCGARADLEDARAQSSAPAPAGIRWSSPGTMSDAVLTAADTTHGTPLAWASTRVIGAPS